MGGVNIAAYLIDVSCMLSIGGSEYNCMVGIRLSTFPRCIKYIEVSESNMHILFDLLEFITRMSDEFVPLSFSSQN